MPACVLARALAQRRRVAFSVEQVVGDLERRADRRAVGGERNEGRLAGAGEPGAGLDAEPYQRARFHRLQARDRLGRQRRRRRLCGDVEHLAADHAGEPRGAGEAGAKRARVSAFGSVSGSARISKASVCKRVAGEDRGRLVEGAMGARASAPKIVVVHRRQIVVDQRIGVQALDRGGGADRPASLRPSARAVSMTRKARNRLPPPSVE